MLNLHRLDSGTAVVYAQWLCFLIDVVIPLFCPLFQELKKSHLTPNLVLSVHFSIFQAANTT